MKEEKYINLQKGIKNLYKDHTVTQMEVVFDFRGGYYTKMEKELNITGTDKKKLNVLLLNAKKWLLSQKNEIVQKFYGYV